jgi:uncharacterized membrane protein
MIKRYWSFALTVSLAINLLPFFSASAFACGVERWSVKTGTDPDAHLVNLNAPTTTTISNLRSLTAPNPIPANNRVQPTETTLWVINCTLTQYKLESDEDYHLIIADSSGNTMITEIPAPTCVGSGSPFLNGITNARNEFNAKFNVTTSFQTANIPVQVTGVGMFDFLHGQTGVAPNGIELHPVLDIIFNPSSSDFSMSASPTSLSLAQGGSGNSTISTTISGSFNSAVSLSASGLPTGATASFSPASIAAPGSGSSTMTITAGASTPTGTSTVTVTGTGGGKTHTTTVSLTVTASTSDFTISASPTSLSITQGGSGTSTISTAVLGSFNSAVSLSASGLPTGATAGFNPTSIAAPGGGSSTMTITVGASTAAGTSTVTITGTGGGKTHTTTVSLTVTASSADFSITASPSAVSIKQGSSGNSTISTTISGSFNSAISLSASGLPTGASASFNPTSIAAPGSGSSTTTITVGASTATGTSTVTVTGTGGGKTHTTTVSLTVTSSGGTTQLLGNPGFENGSNPAPWSATSGVINSSTSEPPHSGTWDAWLDGYGTTHTDTLSQQVTIASTVTTATLSFWLHIDTAETTTTTVYDTLVVQVRDSSGSTVLATLGTFSNLDHNTGYRQVSFDVSSFKGQTIQIWLVGSEDYTLQTSFVVDDFTLNVQ